MIFRSFSYQRTIQCRILDKHYPHQSICHLLPIGHRGSTPLPRCPASTRPPTPPLARANSTTISHNPSTPTTCIPLPGPTPTPSPASDSDRPSRISGWNKSIRGGSRNPAGGSRPSENPAIPKTPKTQSLIYRKIPACSSPSSQWKIGTLCAACPTAEDAGDPTWSKLYTRNG